MTDKLKILVQNFKAYDKIAVCFSGGVDSSLLAAIAKKACDGVIAITAETEFQSRQEMDNAAFMARSIGIRHVVVRSSLLKNLKIVKNTKRRCYFCKKELFSMIRDKASELGFETVAHGANLDDLDDYRPGFEAAREMKIIAPLIDAGLTKDDIRDFSKLVGLDTWNLESQSCLATRIPYGDIITSENLEKVEAGESLLGSLGFGGVRVRIHGEVARIEFGCQSLNVGSAGADQLMKNLMDYQMRREVVAGFKKIGFKFISLDLEGYVMGSMNRSLAISP